MKILKLLLLAVLIIFALIGAGFTFVYFGMQHGVLNVKGTIVERNASFGTVPTTTQQIIDETNGCREGLDQTKPCEWHETAQWDVVQGGLKKDAAVIARVSQETGVDARMIAASVVPEQIRFFSDNREVFKRYFEPLKLLASMSQFSLGVSGIKQTTASKIEENANSTSSVFYTGEDDAKLLAYTAEESNNPNALFDRLTNEKDHYYSYLYTALYLKQITAQWSKAGFDVSKRPDVLVTLFNLGFNASQPKADPKVAGSAITVGGQRYSFGYLGTLFFESDELSSEFPK
jgi:hypothetical protein